MRRKVGAVLIEFAFAIPVFLVLLYYIHDLPKQKLMQRKMQFITNETAAIIQNISRQRPITQKDLNNVMRLSFLSLFPGMTMYSTDSTDRVYPLGYFPHLLVFYVAGVGNQACVKWGALSWLGNPSTGENVWRYTKRIPYQTLGILKFGTNCEASSIHPDLKISDGEVKLIVECSLWYTSDRFFSKGNIPCSSVPVGKAFGFLMHSPSIIKRYCASAYFAGITILSPNASAFTENLPDLK